MNFRIVPIGAGNGRLEIIDHQRLGHAAKIVKGVFQHRDEGVGRLAIDRFAVALARMREHDPQHPRPTPLAIGADDRRARAKVDLSFFARRRFHTPKWQRSVLPQFRHEPANAPVARREVVFVNQILVNPRGAQARIELLDDRLAKRLADARRSGPAGRLR